MDTTVSKTLSYWLRHHPEDAGITPDRQGYAHVSGVLEALNEKFPDRTFDGQWIREHLEPEGNKRFELRGNQLRARYGHSIEVDLDHPPVDNPGPLYHGTSPEAWESIREEGLVPGSRQYVHLSEDREEARRVGSRHARDPVLLRIDVPRDHDRTFQRAGTTILVSYVPPAWIESMSSGPEEHESGS